MNKVQCNSAMQMVCLIYYRKTLYYYVYGFVKPNRIFQNNIFPVVQWMLKTRLDCAICRRSRFQTMMTWVQKDELTKIQMLKLAYTILYIKKAVYGLNVLANPDRPERPDFGQQFLSEIWSLKSEVNNQISEFSRFRTSGFWCFTVFVK